MYVEVSPCAALAVARIMKRFVKTLVGRARQVSIVKGLKRKLAKG